MYLEERGSHCGRIDAAVFAPIVKNLDSVGFFSSKGGGGSVQVNPSNGGIRQ